MARFGEINAQYFDDAGAPLGSGKLYFYESGTTTLKNTYADINLTIANTNPVILTAAGRQPNIFFNGNAKGILTDKNDVQILVRDPIGETGTNFGDAWVATTIYSANSVVIGSDGVYYRSLANGNQNNNPTTTSGFWTLLYSVEWNAGTTYQEGAVVTYDGEQYQSLQNSNLNQNPSTATSYWVLFSFAWISTATYADNQNAVGTDGVLYTSQQAANTGNDPTDPANRPTYWVGTSADAAASAAAAAASETAAAASEAAAATSESNAATSATNSANSATASASSASDSSNSATSSASSATASAASASAAATSESNAATSESNAATSASNSASSATASAASASAASASESAAAASEAAAATSESNAAASASSSASSATSSASSATASASSATDSANSATSSAGSATAAAGSATAAAGSATAAAGSATSAATSATDAAASLDEFTDLYLGAKSSAPTVDNDGNPLQTGALYFNTVSNTMFVYTGSSWVAAGSAVNGTAERQEYTATSGQTNFSATYDVGFVDVYLNGSKLIPTTDFTATDGATIVLTTGATTGDNVSIIAYGAFNVADTYTQAQADAKFAQVANNLSDLASAATARTNLGLVIGTDVEAFDTTILKSADIGVTVQGYDANTTTSTNTQTLTNKTIRDTVYALSGTAFDATNGAVQTKTLSANTTFTDSLSSGDAIVLQLEAGASYTVTWPTMTWVTSGGNVAPTLTAKDTLVFWKVSSVLYGAYTGSYV
jgi:hypothetical protein